MTGSPSADEVLATAHELYARADELYARAGELHARMGGGSADTASRPPIFKVVGIILAVSSGAFIGSSFVLKKYGLLKANEKYNEVAGEGYGYLKNAWWWSGMTLMIIGEICNFVAYSFTDAILVTPLGALSVVITAILSAIFLKERLSMVGKVACFLCIVGSVVIVMNGPQESAVADIGQMQSYVITPGFLSYTGVIVVGSIVTALYAGPRWGKKNMLVYISICSWIGGLSVVATQGLGAAIVTQASGKPQFNGWFIYVLLCFVITTLLTEIIYLNKALNLFNAAMVTPTYYVYFTSTTIITSTVLFQGFKGTPSSIITVVNGFLTICAGVVLLQLSKSAKDVPDAAVFSGDLDQIHTIAEQEQPETEPKADAIRGTAAIVRRLSSARLKMEADELKRLHEEKQREALEPLSEDGTQFEWDGLRRRRTVYGQRSRGLSSSSAFPPLPSTPTPHPPLGWSHMPTQEELDALDRPSTSGALSSIVGTIRTRARSVLLPGHPDFREDQSKSTQSPMQLTEVSVPDNGTGSGNNLSVPGHTHAATFPVGRTTSQGSGASSLDSPPTPPPHLARRQFSFQRVFRRQHDHPPTSISGGFDGAADSPYHRHQQQPQPQQQPQTSSQRPPSRPTRGYSSPQVKDSTEEERLGLVTGDSRSLPAMPRYDAALDEGRDYDEEESELYTDGDDKRVNKYGRGITSSSPPRRSSGDDEKEALAEYEAQRVRWAESYSGGSRDPGSDPPPPPQLATRPPPPRGPSKGAFI